MLDDFRRDVNYNSTIDLNDYFLEPGRYRFKLNGTNAVMPTSCVPVSLHCCAWSLILSLQIVSEWNYYRQIRRTINVCHIINFTMSIKACNHNYASAINNQNKIK